MGYSAVEVDGWEGVCGEGQKTRMWNKRVMVLQVQVEDASVLAPMARAAAKLVMCQTLVQETHHDAVPSCFGECPFLVRGTRHY